MSDKFTLGCGQAHELEMAFERTGWDNAEVKVLTMGDNLKLVKDFIQDHAKLVPVDHLVDCDANLHIPQGYSLKGEGAEHRKGGMVKLERRGDDLYANGKKIELFLADSQKDGRIGGHNLRKVLAEKPVLNANILDYLLKSENQYLIPESYKGKHVFFWGDVYYCGSRGRLYVLCLCWFDDDGWSWYCRWLGNDFDSDSPAAVSASQALRD